MRLTRPRLLAVAACTAAVAAAAYHLTRDRAGAAPPGDATPAALVRVDSRPRTLPAEESETYRKTQAALVKSEFVTNAALRDPQARELTRGQADAPRWLTERLVADYPDGGSLLRIRVTGVAPPDAAALANAVAAAYVREAAEGELRALQDRRRQLEDAGRSLRRLLAAREEQLQQAAGRAGVPAERADQQALLAALYQERAGLRVELARARGPAGPCEPDEREKALRDDLAAVEARITACEAARLDEERSRVALVRDRLAALDGEVLRLELDVNLPPRVQLLAPATPPAE